jgi:hypothetical protein
MPGHLPSSARRAADRLALAPGRRSRALKPRLFPASEQPLAARITPDMQKGLALAREVSVAVLAWPVEARRERSAPPQRAPADKVG